ncbi:MAG: ExeA family protein [Burkholderiales bacterium]
MIYLSHFGLREAPFGITPDTSFYYACRGTQEALNTLLVAIANGEGFIKVIGEVGTGKTLLCRKFLAALGDTHASAYLPNPDLESRTLLLALAEELGVHLDKAMDQHHLLKSLNLALLRFAREKKRVVVCLDEAQAMPIETLETLRLLTNLETEKRKLMQVVLFGQPELDAKLAHPSIRQLRQRITFQHRLQTFSKEETENYLRHRLSVAGYNGAQVFTQAAIRRIHGASRGVPRLINILANKTMMLAYGEGSRQVGWSHAGAAISDTPASHGWTNFLAWLAVVCMAGFGLGWVLLK